MIPKIIHYCWFGEEMPARLQNYMAGWKRLMPDYEFICWNENNFDIHSVKWVEQAVEAKRWEFASDYIRLWAVYNYGGIYLDCDIDVLKPFDDLLALPYFLGDGVGANNVEISAFGAQKNIFWLKDCLEYYERMEFLKSNGAFNPIVITDTVFHILNKKHEFLLSSPETFDYNTSKINLFSKEYFTCRAENVLTQNTYTMHYTTASWSNNITGYPRIHIQPNNRKLYVWGTGNDAGWVLKQCKENNWQIESFLDSKAESEEFIFNGYNCVSPLQVLKSSERDFFIIVSSRAFSREILKILKSYNLVENKDFWLPLSSELVDY